MTLFDITAMQGIQKKEDSQSQCKNTIGECSRTHLKPVPGEAPSDPSVTVMVKGKGQREEGSENESGLKVGKVEGAQLLGWVMPDPLNVASVQTSACVPQLSEHLDG